MHSKLQQFYLRKLFKKKLVGEKNKIGGTLHHLARDILRKWEIQKIGKSCVFKNDCNPSSTYGMKHRQETGMMLVP